MAKLRLGPLLRYVDWETGDNATIWVETDRPCEVEVACADGDEDDAGEGGAGPGGGDADVGARPGGRGAGGCGRTWQVAGHHYALVPVTGLRPGRDVPYRVLLDGAQVWPLADSPFPPSTIRTPAARGDDTADGAGPETVRVAFGSCRWATPPADSSHDPVGPDALDTLAKRLAQDPGADRPDVLVLLGDQVYADETSAATRGRIAARRDIDEPPWDQVADYEEYSHLYYESWLDPEVRWLLSTVPSSMIFDDHDIIDDWNTSAAWLSEIRSTSWWHERVLSGLMSYWVYQHLGNFSPAELAADKLYAQVRAAADGTDLVREFAALSDSDPACARWSYRRDFGRVRLVMVDTRAARVLEEGDRSMLDDGEMEWVRDQLLTDHGGYDHLLIGTSLPWLLPPAIHDAEVWDAALCNGERGARWARIGEKMRQGADLEHWAAFPCSFAWLTALIARVGNGPNAPATICVMSGDVHHAYIAEPHWPGGAGAQPRSRVLQLTCSPVHNSIPRSIRLGFRFGWSRAGRWLGRALARHGRVPRPVIGWRKTGGPWFGNQLMTLTLRGRHADLRLDQARRKGESDDRLVGVLNRRLTQQGDPSHNGG
ncbi:DUF7800 domain-containing protein [Streptomyces sp. H27-D2]|uniref:DUF7800 domain-containing protein n=1 Tax=Streptomyces sp. H27-D2 TaxID=3046304 RepID=UPI002DBA8279|nr:alkaline phosphatase D family protein [Streptomyces sp. H27-D2]MEC4016214.1 alkaline phosphatase D family protein [Streptomyces sp. H27-D2]